MAVYSLEAKLAIRLIVIDMATDLVPVTVRSFEQLHESVDANMYVLAVYPDLEINEANVDGPFSDLIAEIDQWFESLPAGIDLRAIQALKPVF